MNTNEEVWLHLPTMTTALVHFNFGYFYFNGRKEESFWGIFREEPTDWVYICDLNSSKADEGAKP